MKRLALLTVNLLVLALVARADAKTRTKAADKPLSDLTGMSIGIDIPHDSWSTSTGPDGRPEGGSIGSIRHNKTNAAILLYGQQSWKTTPAKVLKALERDMLIPDGQIVVSRVTSLPRNGVPTIAVLTWRGISKDDDETPIMGKFYIRRLDPPFDDVIVTILGSWKGRDAGLAADFDFISETVKVEPIDEP